MNEPTPTTPGADAATASTPPKRKGRPSRMMSPQAARESGPPKPRTLPFVRADKPSAKKAGAARKSTAATLTAPKSRSGTGAKGSGTSPTGGGAPKAPATSKAPKAAATARGTATEPRPRPMGGATDFGPEFAPGNVVRVAYNHPGVGACTYGVRREGDGSFTLAEYQGARTGLFLGKTWKNAWLMLTDLVGRPRHNVPLRRWFRLPPRREP